MYKVGPVLSISHGMGIPSAGILLHEVIKLMYHAGVTDPVFIRLGTCGGIDLPPGTVVVTKEALDGRLRPYLDTIVLGEVKSRLAKMDLGLAKNLVLAGGQLDKFQTVLGKTISTDDFYEGQVGRDFHFDYNSVPHLIIAFSNWNCVIHRIICIPSKYFPDVLSMFVTRDGWMEPSASTTRRTR